MHGRQTTGWDDWFSCPDDFSASIGLIIRQVIKTKFQRTGIGVKDGTKN
jgi:hypothetical protein